MRKFAYPEIWKKSFLLEIVSSGSQPSELFTFSLPPQNIETIYPQRVSETKTFGGLFVDDYGSDVAKITLSGNTGNSEIKCIYRGTRGDLWLSGKEEIYYIRDHIVRYKENYSDAKLYLYNLATVADDQITDKNYDTATDSWEVILKDFKVSQSKDRPFWYAYSIEFTGLRILGKEKEATTAGVTRTTDSITLLDDADAAVAPLEDPEEVMMLSSNWVTSADLAGMHALEPAYLPAAYYPDQPVEERLKLAMADGTLSSVTVAKLKASTINGKGYLAQLTTITNARDAAEEKMRDNIDPLLAAYTWSSKIADPVRNLRKQISKLKSKTQTYKALVSGIINNTLFSVPTQMMGLVRDISDLGFGVVTAPADIANDVISQCKKVRKGMSSLLNDLNNMPDYVKSKYNSVFEAFQAEIEACVYTAENKLDAVAAQSALLSDNPDVYLLPAESDNENPVVIPSETDSGATTRTTSITPRVMLVHGYQYITATDGITLDVLAQQYLGNPDNAVLIAIANGISEETEIEPGTIIKIPVLENARIIVGNEVYSITDNYGVDIALSEFGAIEIASSGELATISGTRNITQAIRSRLAESIENRIRLTVYGIRSGIGKPMLTASAYVATSIKDTIIHDPRIARVENFIFRGFADRIYIQFDYVTIDGGRGTYGGIT